MKTNKNVNFKIYSKFIVSASRKQKYYDPDISSFSNYNSLIEDEITSKPATIPTDTILDSSAKLNDFDVNSIDSLSLKSDKNDLISNISNTSQIKRYKMERKNSQQSQHGKQESFAASRESTKNSIQLECDPNLLELIGHNEISVKIADLGNACYNVCRICFSF